MSSSIQYFQPHQPPAPNTSLSIYHNHCSGVVPNFFDFTDLYLKLSLNQTEPPPLTQLDDLNEKQSTIKAIATAIKTKILSIYNWNPSLLPVAYADTSSMQNKRKTLEEDVKRLEMSASKCKHMLDKQKDNGMVQDSPSITKTNQSPSPTIQSTIPYLKGGYPSNWGDFLTGVLIGSGIGSIVTFLITTIGVYTLQKRRIGSYSPVKNQEDHTKRACTINLKNIPPSSVTGSTLL